MLTLAKVAKHLDLGVSSVSHWFAKQGLDWRSMTIDQVRVAYIRSLREQAAGRSNVDGDLDLVTERAALAKAQRERVELQNAVTRQELAPVSTVEEVLAKAGARVSGILDGIPGMVRRRNPDLPASTIDAIRDEIAKARNVAAGLTLEEIMDGQDGSV